MKVNSRIIAQFEPVFLYLFTKKHKLTKAQDLKNTKLKLGQSKARVDVHNPDKKFKHYRVKIVIYFMAVGLISIPSKKILSLWMKCKMKKVLEN